MKVDNNLYFIRENDNILEKAFENWRFVLLFGARQIGKTTLADKYFAKVNIKKLKIQGQNKDIQQSLGDLSLSKIKMTLGDAEFIFIDEAQYITDIGTVLKLIYDTMPNVKVLTTGSSAFGLASKTSEAMTGRKISLSAFPLSVREIKENKIFDNIYYHVDEMLLYGNYPKVLASKDKALKENILAELADSYLYKDVLEFHGIKKAPAVAKLAKMLALQIGNQVSLSELATALEINKATVANYIDVLIKSFIIFPLPAYSKNKRKELSTSMKYYFYDNGIRNAIIKNFSDKDIRNDLGAMWENFIISEFYKRYTYNKKPFTIYHWRTYDQKEVDLIIEVSGKLEAYECKYNDDKLLVSKSIRNTWEEFYPNTKINIVNKSNFYDIIK